MKIEREKFRKKGHFERNGESAPRYCICRKRCDKCLMICCDLCHE